MGLMKLDLPGEASTKSVTLCALDRSHKSLLLSDGLYPTPSRRHSA